MKKQRKPTPTPQEKHRDCSCTIRLTGKLPHYAEIRCVDHDKQVQWLSKADYEYIQKKLVDKYT